ncbi:MmcQ/YjbR family DNA-binding protein [Pelagibius litoralis]|uniref:MmcQ/YjbR family DNA-binding protein n=1 Tax=Pelagibius litoralis TaxID=374515 RepID=A0A967EY63_9PROT|nr:MmcQ/YjbR family DNA-binding protein [Pelagibius litoralis]NIA69572.1 MmcQ/YjbR family DNA-binding protein [Pelagibius litoralis]
MTRDDFDRFCGSLAATTNVIQWGNASVWKVGGKIFAICSHWGAGEQQKISFKCSDLSYTLLCEQEGIAPAPYLARAKWVQLQNKRAMKVKDIKAYVEEAHRIVAAKLTKKQKAGLGL